MNDGIVVAFGRMNPPTTAHARLIGEVYKLSLKNQWDHCIYVSTVHDSINNPIPIYHKLYFLRQMFPNVRFAELPNFLSVMKSLSTIYNNIAVVAGGDRVEDYDRILENYNGKDFTFENWATINMERNDTVSASRMRNAAINNDFYTFQRLCAKESFAADLFKSVRENLKIFQ